MVQKMKEMLSMGECYQIWKQESQDTLNPLTFRRYDCLLQKHLLPYFENMKAKDITEKNIDVFIEEKQKENLSLVTQNMLIMLLKRLLQTAEIDTVGLGLEHTVRIHTGKRSTKIMGSTEQQLLDSILNNSNNPKYLGICLAFKMGLAIGEICALEWKDIDFDNEIMQIDSMIQRIQNAEGQDKKTMLVKMPLSISATRKLPIPKLVMKQLLFNRKEEGYVVECKKGRMPDPRREQMRLEKFLEKQEIKKYNFHILRDTFAVRCIEAGMSIENLSYVLGHSSPAITAARYKKFLNEKETQVTHLRRIMELI